MALCHESLGSAILEGDTLVYTVSDDGSLSQATIVRDARPLTKEEVQQNKGVVSAGKIKEIRGLHTLGCFKRMSRHTSKNRVDTRWVITWKLVDGVWVVKCRLTMRGFRDRCMTLETFAGTASRAGQRIVNSEAAQNDDFVLFSFDVSQAFAKGLTFEEIARLTGTPLREVEFDLASEDVQYLKSLPGFEDFDPARETIQMIKPIYGLKDAPRAWRQRLHQVLSSFGLCQLLAEPELYVKHDKGRSVPRQVSIKDRVAREEAAGQEEESKPISEFLESRRAQLELICSAHVDDIKGAARKDVAQQLLKHLNDAFSECKNE